MGQTAIIYGENNRHSPHSLNSLSIIQKSIQATAVMIPDATFNISKDGKSFEFDTHITATDQFMISEDEMDFTEEMHATCTGFLINEDTIVTAAHCLRLKQRNAKVSKLIEACSKMNWLFDYLLDENGVLPQTFATQNLYKCSKVLAYQYDGSADYAIIKLDRATGRTPLTVRTGGSLRLGTPLFTISSIMGTSLKVIDGATAKVNENYSSFFNANIDGTNGGSGSPVINGITGVVEGIYIAGGEDLYYSSDDVNFKENRCSDEGKDCNIADDKPFENVFKITELPYSSL